MAIKKDVTFTKDKFAGELKATDVYCKVESIMGTKEKQQAVVRMYADETLIDSKVYEFVPNMDGDNFIKQAYKYLKTLPEFTGATDC